MTPKGFTNNVQNVGKLDVVLTDWGWDENANVLEIYGIFPEKTQRKC